MRAAALVLVTELGHTLMVYLDIGMKINTLCVVALGVGIGVDYGIYIFARMREAMLQGKTLTESYFIALKTTGIAIFYTALTLAVGVAMWIFSVLKFQADMGILLTFMFIVNMIAAIIFLPALCAGSCDEREGQFRCQPLHEKPIPSTPAARYLAIKRSQTSLRGRTAPFRQIAQADHQHAASTMKPPIHSRGPTGRAATRCPGWWPARAPPAGRA